jgi:hypothetical protein
MEFDDTLNRLFRHRRYLLVVAIAVGLAAYFLATRTNSPTYRAQSRLLLGPTASSSQEAQVMVDRARAVATSEQVLNQAIAEAKVPRTPAGLAASTNVSGVTDSGIATLSVVDKDPAAAAALCRALSDATVAFINKTNTAPTQNTLSSLQTQVRQQLDRYAEVQATTQPGSPAGEAQLSAITQDLGALSSARGQLLARQAQQVPAEVIDEPPARGERTPDDAALIAGLCIVGALLVWLLGAVAMVSLRPTAPTLRSVARHFDAPLLGRLDGDLAEPDAASAEVVDRLALSARRLHVSTLMVAGDLEIPEDFATRLEDAMQSSESTANVSVAAIAGARNGRAVKTALAAPIRVLSVGDVNVAPASGVGVLVVARPGMRWAKLLRLEELLRCGRWPVVGVVQVV